MRRANPHPKDGQFSRQAKQDLYWLDYGPRVRPVMCTGKLLGESHSAYLLTVSFDRGGQPNRAVPGRYRILAIFNSRKEFRNYKSFGQMKGCFGCSSDRKKGGAVSMFAGPVSFTAGGPNLSRPTKDQANYDLAPSSANACSSS